MRSTIRRTLLAAIALPLLTSCQFVQTYRTSSVVDYLYPEEREPVAEQRIPELSLPLRIGVAFTPASASHTIVALSEKEKQELMEEVSSHFTEYDFVEAIELIPSAYLKPQGGFANVDQLARMFNIDVIALLSFDQTRFQEEGMASLAYWTLVGAYVVAAERNDTHTLLDAAVYDIKSRNLLFRAPGVSTVKSRSTIIGMAEQAREDSMQGFREASADLVVNLKEQLELFRERAKSSPEEVQIARREGYSGGVAIDPLTLMLVLLLVAAGSRRRAG